MAVEAAACGEGEAGFGAGSGDGYGHGIADAVGASGDAERGDGWGVGVDAGVDINADAGDLFAFDAVGVDEDDAGAGFGAGSDVGVAAGYGVDGGVVAELGGERGEVGEFLAVEGAAGFKAEFDFGVFGYEGQGYCGADTVGALPYADAAGSGQGTVEEVVSLVSSPMMLSRPVSRLEPTSPQADRIRLTRLMQQRRAAVPTGNGGSIVVEGWLGFSLRVVGGIRQGYYWRSRKLDQCLGWLWLEGDMLCLICDRGYFKLSCLSASSFV